MQKNKNIAIMAKKATEPVPLFSAAAAKDKGLAIGRGGKNIEKVKKLSLRYHNIEDVIIQ